MENLKVLKNELISQFEKESTTKSLLDVRLANEWVESSKKKPKPKRLFGDLWFENEICILFADTNQGKSILAVQIAESISTGISTCGLRLDSPPQKVVYFDFELSEKQFENRYSEDFTNHYLFSENFFRAEINTDFEEDISSFETYLFTSLEKIVAEDNVKVLIIDNITYLKSDMEKAKDALPLMKFLKNLKKKYNLSLLVLAHTPKRDNSKQITKNDLSGSKALINFCDSCFAIGESFQDKGIKYIKQIKQRSVELIYDCNNIIIFEIQKVNSFLQFSFLDYGTENEHLRYATDEEKQERNNIILELKNQGLSNVAIGKQLFCSEATVRNVLKKLSNS